MKGPTSEFEPELRQVEQREGDQGVSCITEEEEEDTAAFLMIEKQVKKQSMIPADQYLVNFLHRYS